MAKATSGAVSSVVNFLRRYIKKPWEITGPCAHPEYRGALLDPREYRAICPATTPKVQAIIPTSSPETVFDIKYFSRDQRRNRPPIKRTILRKDDVLKMMKEKKSFDLSEFPPVYLVDAVEEDLDALGGGYQA